MERGTMRDDVLIDRAVRSTFTGLVWGADDASLDDDRAMAGPWRAFILSAAAMLLFVAILVGSGLVR